MNGQLAVQLLSAQPNACALTLFTSTLAISL
jgi:hypothetical protein